MNKLAVRMAARRRRGPEVASLGKRRMGNAREHTRKTQETLEVHPVEGNALSALGWLSRGLTFNEWVGADDEQEES